MNIFSLHGKWYENNENRLTSNFLFFLDKFRKEILNEFTVKYLSQKINFNKAEINFQVYDTGDIPDGEILFDNSRILIESKINNNHISEKQITKYIEKLRNTEELYNNKYLIVITQTNQKSIVDNYIIENNISDISLIYIQWLDILDFLIKIKNRTNNNFLQGMLDMFLEEVESTLYNKLVIDDFKVKDIYEVVLTVQNKEFERMALDCNVFWPKNNFSPAQYVAYYFTKNSSENQGTISHIAKIKYIWHNITIDEVLSSTKEFELIPNYQNFKNLAHNIYPKGSESKFAIAITDTPIKLKTPISFNYGKDKRIHPNILPGRHTTIEKIINASELEDL